MNQQEKQELKVKLWNIAKLIIVIILLWSLGLVVFKFFGLCAFIFTAATIATSFIVYSLLSREHRKGIMESSIKIYIIIGFVLYIIVLWLFVYGVCVEID